MCNFGAKIPHFYRNSIVLLMNYVLLSAVPYVIILDEIQHTCTDCYEMTAAVNAIGRKILDKLSVNVLPLTRDSESILP